MILSRRKPQKMGVRAERKLSFPHHRQWVRGHCCSVPGCGRRDIEAAHYDGPIPNEDRGGMSAKDHDKWCLPLCRDHHTLAGDSYHRLGWQEFDRRHGVNTKAIAETMARRSPHRWRWKER